MADHVQRCTRCQSDCPSEAVSFTAAGPGLDHPAPFTLCPACLVRLEVFLNRARPAAEACRRIPIGNLETPRQYLERVKRNAAILDGEVSLGTFLNFVGPAYNLIDWVKNNDYVPATAKHAVVGLYGDRWVKICGDLANTEKHHNLIKRVPMTDRVDPKRGWGAGRYGKGGFGIGEEEIIVTLEDGTTIDCLELAEKVIAAWDDFFRTHNL